MKNLLLAIGAGALLALAAYATLGPPGAAGKSAYQSWLDLGNTGTEAQFIASLKGETGAAGPRGPAGPPGSGGGSGGGGLPRPTTQAEFVSLVNAALKNCKVAQFDGTSYVDVTSPIIFEVSDCGHMPVGFNGNGMTLNSMINNGADIVTIKSTHQNRSLFVTNLHIYGGTYDGRNSGTCLTVTAESGGKPIYKFTLTNIWVDSCGNHGLSLIGDVYEGAVYNLQSENNNGSGAYLAHGPNNAILSNVYLIGANSSRNKRYGVEAGAGATSIQVTQFSFINNHMGGALFPWGARSVLAGNCENTGQICIDMPTSTYTSAILNVEGSTDNNVAGAGGTGSMKYLYRYGGDPAKLNQAYNSIVCYGANCSGSGVKLKAP